jgi:hypothetical protein
MDGLRIDGKPPPETWEAALGLIMAVILPDLNVTPHVNEAQQST